MPSISTKAVSEQTDFRIQSTMAPTSVTIDGVSTTAYTFNSGTVKFNSGRAQGETIAITYPDTTTGALSDQSNSTNQQSEINALAVLHADLAALLSSQARALSFVEATNQALSANAFLVGPGRDSGAAPVLYTRFNAVAVSNQNGILRVDCSPDGTNWFAVSSSNHPGGGAAVTITTPLVVRYYRAVLLNSGTAAVVSVFDSFTAA